MTVQEYLKQKNTWRGVLLPSDVEDAFKAGDKNGRIEMVEILIGAGFMDKRFHDAARKMANPYHSTKR